MSPRTALGSSLPQRSAAARFFFVGALLVAGVLPVAVHLAAPAGGRIAQPAWLRPAAVEDDAPARVDWPTHFRDRPLTQQPLSALEQRFARRFPGAIARFTDGESALILRQVTRPTRQLHPATDCFAALGWRIERPRPQRDEAGLTWSCFVAARDGTRLRVCERIRDSEGREWTDTSAWFWAAQYGGGPWWATTVVETLEQP
jgi:hypothetical protein